MWVISFTLLTKGYISLTHALRKEQRLHRVTVTSGSAWNQLFSAGTWRTDVHVSLQRPVFQLSMTSYTSEWVGPTEGVTRAIEQLLTGDCFTCPCHHWGEGSPRGLNNGILALVTMWQGVERSPAWSLEWAFGGKCYVPQTTPPPHPTPPPALVIPTPLKMTLQSTAICSKATNLQS